MTALLAREVEQNVSRARGFRTGLLRQSTHEAGSEYFGEFGQTLARFRRIGFDGSRHSPTMATLRLTPKGRTSARARRFPPESTQMKPTARNKRKKGPWQLLIADCEPKRPELIEQAAAHLGPFKFATNAEALSNNWTFMSGDEITPISRDNALCLLLAIATRFNRDDRLSKDAPRFKHVRQDLHEVKQIIDLLRTALSNLNDITRHELRFTGSEGIHDSRIMALAEIHALPQASNDESPPTDITWDARLGALSDHYQFTIERLAQERAKKRQVKDRGGNTNLWKETFGNPRWGLAIDSLTLFDAFKPDQARPAPGGNFHNFVLDVFEFATGSASVDCAKMDDWIKDIVPAYRAIKQLDARIDKIRDQIFALQQQPVSPEIENELLSLDAEWAVLVDRKLDFSAKLWPHVPLKRSQPSALSASPEANPCQNHMVSPVQERE